MRRPGRRYRLSIDIGAILKEYFSNFDVTFFACVMKGRLRTAQSTTSDDDDNEENKVPNPETRGHQMNKE